MEVLVKNRNFEQKPRHRFVFFANMSVVIFLENPNLKSFWATWKNVWSKLDNVLPLVIQK